VQAAFAVIAERGIELTRTADIARRAGVAAGTIHYYYDAKDDLLLEATRQDIDAFHHWLVDQLGTIEGPLERLRYAVHATLPDEQGDPGWTVLLQFWSRAIYHHPLRAMAALFQERARALYVSLLEDGRRQGVFRMTGSSESVARSLMAMIDGLSFQIILGDPSLTAHHAEQLCMEYLCAVTGVSVGES
jgi:AcrR family transcriptional regulator